MEKDFKFTLWAWFSKQVSPDGLLVHENVEGNREQLTTTQEDLAQYFKTYAAEIAKETKKTVYLAEFHFAGFKEVLMPDFEIDKERMQ